MYFCTFIIRETSVILSNVYEEIQEIRENINWKRFSLRLNIVGITFHQALTTETITMTLDI